MKNIRFPLLFLAASLLAPAQLTRDQKIADFTQLAALYAKQYGPYEWKRDVMGFDLYKVQPWLERVARSRDDPEFYDLCSEYVAGLKDSHDYFRLPSNFRAWLGFSVDIYDGKVLIESITRRTLPADTYPFQVGDELVSLDGQPVQEWISALVRYAGWLANPRGARRAAAQLIVNRQQAVLPRAHEVGERAEVVIQRASGDLEHYSIPWQKTGVPLISMGPVPSPGGIAAARAASAMDLPADTPDYMRDLLELWHSGKSGDSMVAVSGIGSMAPIFGPPQGFQQRLGRAPTDSFYSGVYSSGDFRIGLLRIPAMSPNGIFSAAYQQFESEIAYFEENTDGLVVDVMRNPGGLIIYGHELARRLIPFPFKGVGFELRATASRVANFSSRLESARASNSPDWVIALWEALLKDVRAAFSENRGRTGPLPLDMPSLDVEPATDRTGKIIAYTKPLIVLIDEFSVSTADLFPALIQDSRRGPLVGMRTAGGGGTNGSFPGTTYSEGTAGVTFGLMVRPLPVATTEFPTTQYIENVGVRPDLELDYMTRENLLTRGRPFVEAFTAKIIEEIKAAR